MYILEILHVCETSCVQLSKIAPYKFHKEAQIAAVCDIIGLVHEHICELVTISNCAYAQDFCSNENLVQIFVESSQPCFLLRTTERETRVSNQNVDTSFLA